MTTTSVPTETYLFERRPTSVTSSQRRLHALAALFDPATRRLLTEVGVARGSRCLEVAAGTGSVAAWLADQVGPEGEVFATDIDLTHLVRAAAERHLRPARHRRPTPCPRAPSTSSTRGCSSST